MRRSLPALLALLFAAAPLTAQAGARLSASATEVRSGEVIELQWSGLDPAVEEVELEYSVSGGHWAQLSPELVGEARAYRWRTPWGVAGEVRVRLRQGERHAESVAAEITLRLVSDAQREPAQGVRSADAWDIDRSVHGPLHSHWGPHGPSWSATHAGPALAASTSHDAPREEPRSSPIFTSEHASVASLVTQRSFESRRRSPLRN